MKGQPKTWFGHGLAALAITVFFAVIAMVFDVDKELATMFGASSALSYYIYREERDEDAHKAKGDWGSKWEWDKYGDLIGPIFVWLTWMCAVVIL